MMSCPTCGKPVDPLRAPAVKVSAGKVVPFCSKQCAAAAETQPVRAPAEARAADSATPRASDAAAGRSGATAKARTPVSGVPSSRKDVDSGPVIEIVHEPASGVVTSAADARSGRAHTSPRAETSGAIQIADTGYLDDYVAYEEPRRSRAGLVVLLLLVLVAGAGAAAYYMGYLDPYLDRDSSAAVTPKTEVQTPAAVVIDAPPPITPEMALDRARAVLLEQMKSNSPRVQRVAAMALARTGDKGALEFLVDALDKESSELAKLEIGYALARGGERRGTEVLMAAATGGKRDPRLEAGRRLALLGDKRAVNVLENYLPVTQLRLGIAEQLAYLAGPRAIKVLEDVRADETSHPDEKARATIALGHAGRTDVVPELHALLTDDRNNAFAAVALAELKDEAARPVLEKQLTIPSLRVQAARALRRLAPDKPLRELLPPLVAELDTNKDTEQVQIAEAILLLAGPSAWSERE